MQRQRAEHLFDRPHIGLVGSGTCWGAKVQTGEGRAGYGEKGRESVQGCFCTHGAYYNYQTIQLLACHPVQRAWCERFTAAPSSCCRAIAPPTDQESLAPVLRPEIRTALQIGQSVTHNGA